MALSVSDLLSQTIEATIGWFADWSRLAFFKSGRRADALSPPPAFHAWQEKALNSGPGDQDAFEKIASLHEQLHRLARLVLLNATDEPVIPQKDYDAVAAKYEELILELRRMERAFSVAASGLDLLTGLRSRTGLAEDLTREQNRFLRSARPYCLALMDIDHFKKINDTHGHDAGDKVLASVADHVSRGLRSFDDAYRWGGEEFLLCLKEADATIGAAVLERLRAELAEKPILLADGKSIPVTASFGFAVSKLDILPDDLIRAADQALYQAKNGGRNKVIMSASPPR